jgi:hypothetical protein
MSILKALGLCIMHSFKYVQRIVEQPHHKAVSLSILLILITMSWETIQAS